MGPGVEGARTGGGRSRRRWCGEVSARMGIHQRFGARGALRLQAASLALSSATPYLPVVDLLKAYFGIDPEDAENRARERVTARLLELDRALTPALPALATLLDFPSDGERWDELDPMARRTRIQDAI